MAGKKKSSTVKVTVNASNKQRHKRDPSARKRGRRRKRKLHKLTKIPGLTPTGLEFLKCAIASRDFPGAKAGVPDCSTGASIVLRHRSTQVFTPTGNTWSALLAPTPGVAAWVTYSSFQARSMLTPVPFNDQASLFGLGTPGTAPSQTANVNSFRYVGMTFEIKPVSALLNNSGLIVAARVPTITCQTSPSPVGTEYISGLYNVTNSSLTTLPAYFSGHINQGVYGWSVNQAAVWEYTPLNVGINNSTDVNFAELTTSGALDITGGTQFMGWGNMTPICISITGSSPTTSWALTVEQIVEYRATPGSLLAEAADDEAAPCDEVALMAYKKAARELPAFVRADDNDGFWDKFLKVMGTGLNAVGTAMGGPWGMAAGGLGNLALGLRQLIL